MQQQPGFEVEDMGSKWWYKTEDQKRMYHTTLKKGFPMCRLWPLPYLTF